MFGTRIEGAGCIRMTFGPSRPFNDLPNLPPASEAVTRSILRSCITARAALAELRASERLYPTQAMLINLIPCSKHRRVLNLLCLVDKDLLDIPVLCLSRYIIQNKALHYRYLFEVTSQQAWETWVLFILEAVRSTAERTTAKSTRSGSFSTKRQLRFGKRCRKSTPENWQN